MILVRIFSCYFKRSELTNRLSLHVNEVFRAVWNLNPWNPKSVWLLNSPHCITLESIIQDRENKGCSWLLNEFSLPTSKKCIENSMETLKGNVSCKGLIWFPMCEETRSITSLLSLAAYDKPIVSSPSLSLPPLPPPPPRFISELG